jgi:hypothetical protein
LIDKAPSNDWGFTGDDGIEDREGFGVGCYNMIGTSISSSSVDLAKPERKMIKKNKLPR